MRVRRPLAALSVPAVLALSLLGGCGVAGTDFHPGIAAQVGRTTISTAEVDSVARDYCTAIEGALQKAGQAAPLRSLRAASASSMVVRAAVSTLASDYGVRTGTGYQKAVSQVRSQLTQLGYLSADQIAELGDAVIEVETTDAYASDLVAGIGRATLLDQGNDNPTDAEAASAGQKVFAAWLDDQDVEIDPRFGLEVADGAVKSVDTSLTYASSTEAVAGQSTSQDPAAALALPASQRCG